MANIAPVHVESHENGWAVVREGLEEPISVHRTQAEAAKEGRSIARREETQFFLHARDGRIRERSSYGDLAAKSQDQVPAVSISRIGGGAVVGTVIGSLLLPGVGTILGGAIGGLVGAALGAAADAPSTESDPPANGPSEQEG